jgi:hypothetical protein
MFALSHALNPARLAGATSHALKRLPLTPQDDTAANPAERLPESPASADPRSRIVERLSRPALDANPAPQLARHSPFGSSGGGDASHSPGATRPRAVTAESFAGTPDAAEAAPAATRPRTVTPAAEEEGAEGATRPRYADEVDEARYQSVFGTPQPTGLKARIMEALKAAGVGAAQGAAMTGDWRGALAGAATGGVIAGVSPTAGRELRFEMARPYVEQQEAARQKRVGERLRQELTGAQIGTEQARGRNYQSIIESRGRKDERDSKLDEAALELKRLEQEQRRLQNDLARETNPLRARELQGRIDLLAAQRENALASASAHTARAGLADRSPGTGAGRGEQNRRLTQATTARAAFEEAKGRAEEAARVLGGLQPTDPKHKSAQAAYDAARRQMREKHAALRAFDGVLEVGEGAGGWPYAKPKSGEATASAAPGAVKVFPAGKLAEFAESKGMTEDEAREYVTGKGWTIR